MLSPFVEDVDFTLYCGDALEVLRQLPAESVHCALTSPPFYGLRDYGVDGQIGLEETPDEWVQRLVAVFAEVRRVLRADGTLWVECGDSYAGSRCGPAGDDVTGRHVVQSDAFVKSKRSGKRWGGGDIAVAELKPKDLMLQPFMLAMALRADGWWLRQIIVWHKPNAMPESATDRCTTAHSYVFLLSKSARYHFDADAIAEPAAWERWGDQTVPKHEGTDTAAGWIQSKTKRELQGEQDHRYEGLVGQTWKPRTKAEIGAAGGGRQAPNGLELERRNLVGSTFNNNPNLRGGDGTKNPRSVWTIPTRGFPGAHFATWPEALVERILKAGCPEGGTCLDPFFGSGTTGVVARRHGRRTVGIELNVDYCRMAAERLQQLSLLA